MKKIIMSIIAIILCLTICSCGKTNYPEDGLQMKINIEESTIYLSDANDAIINAVYAIKASNKDHSIACFKKAIELIEDVKTRVDSSISYPNFISIELEELEANYKETIILLSGYSDFLEEEMDEAVELIVYGTFKHIRLLKIFTAFSSLYEIREFDHLPEDEAQNRLKEDWWKFLFSDDIECPESIDYQELYLIWARQYLEEIDEDEFLEQLENVRENDNLSSKDCNQRWTEFIENFIIKME